MQGRLRRGVASRARATPARVRRDGRHEDDTPAGAAQERRHGERRGKRGHQVLVDLLAHAGDRLLQRRGREHAVRAQPGAVHDAQELRHGRGNGNEIPLHGHRVGEVHGAGCDRARAGCVVCERLETIQATADGDDVVAGRGEVQGAVTPDPAACAGDDGG